MTWQVEYTDEFQGWWATLEGAQQNAVDVVLRLLEARGPQLPFPYSSGIATSKDGRMRELRIQCGGKPYRVFYAFDPRRIAILLIGGRKTGNDRFYESMISQADRLYDQHVNALRREEGHG